MLIETYDLDVLKKLLVKDTPLICINITFDTSGKCGISYIEGKVKYVDSYRERLIWADKNNPNRTLMLASFGQLVPGFNHNNINFYGLFFPQGYSFEILLASARALYSNMLKYYEALGNTINTISTIIEEKQISDQTKKKIERYRKYKRFIKYGGDWLKRPYHNVKNISEYDMWKLYGERKLDFERRRAYKIFDNVKKDKFKIKYPKLHKKFIEVTTTESRVLKKDKWKI